MIKINFSEFNAIQSGLAKMSARSDAYYDRALNDAVQIVLIETKRRYQEQVSPDETPWTPNSEMWTEIKGQDTVLTGPISEKIKGGPYAGKYKLAKTSKKKMKNSLVHEVQSVLKRAVIFYDKESEERAQLHFYGGESTLVLNSTTGGKDKVFYLDVPARPHLGINEKDASKIEEVFGKLLESNIEQSLL